VTAEPNLLVISGEKTESEGTQYLYRGIPSVAFEQRFNLADYVQVRDAQMRMACWSSTSCANCPRL
jgi:molecular chaperone IbpA